MLRIGQLKLNPNHTQNDLLQKIAKMLRISDKEIKGYQIKKQSIDARKKPLIQYVYTVDVDVANERQIMKKHNPLMDYYS